LFSSTIMGGMMTMSTAGRSFELLMCCGVWNGGIFKVPPVHGLSFEVHMIGDRTPDNDLTYSLT